MLLMPERRRFFSKDQPYSFRALHPNRALRCFGEVFRRSAFEKVADKPAVLFDLKTDAHEAVDQVEEGGMPERRRFFLKDQPDLFRAVHPNRVLRCFGEVFSRSAFETAAAKATSQLSPAGLLDANNDAHEAADQVYYACQQVERVGAFLSHVWAADRGLKVLALYYYLNIESAVIASVGAWIVTICIMVIINGPFGMNAQPGMLMVFLGVPMLVFVVVLFCGHMVRVPIQTMWLDKLSIHQTRKDLQIKGVTAIPEFVAKSDRMIVLWSDTYFERLWCNAEVASFAAINGAARLDMLPLWFAPWIIVTMTLNVVSIIVSSKLFVWIPHAAKYIASTGIVEQPSLLTFSSLFVGVGCTFTVAYLPLIVPTWYATRTKLDIQSNMLSQCREFAFGRAKCRFESDREVVADMIKYLWKDYEYPIVAFDEFVNERLSNHIENSTGSAKLIPYRCCLLLMLPWLFSSAFNVFGCDGMPREMAAEIELGAGSKLAQQMLTKAATCAISFFGIYPTVYPVRLYLMNVARSKFELYPFARVVTELCAVIVSFTCMGFHEGFAAGLINAASSEFFNGSTRDSCLWMASLVLYLVLLILWNLHLFPTRLDPDDDIFEPGEFLRMPTGFVRQGSMTSLYNQFEELVDYRPRHHASGSSGDAESQS